MNNGTNGFNSRVLFANMLFSTLTFCFSNIASAADDVGSLLSEKLKKFTPPDLAVVAPADDVPKACALFTGKWGPFAMSLIRGAGIVVVESIATDCSIKVVMVTAESCSFPNDPCARWARYDAKIVNGEFSMPGIAAGSTWRVNMGSSGTELEVRATNTRGQTLYGKIPR